MINQKKNYYFFLLIIIFLYGIYCSINIGKSWDTFHFVNIGKERLSYLLQLGTNSSTEENFSSLAYPAIYNTLSAFILMIFPIKFELEIFHLTNFLISFLTSIGVYKFTKKLLNQKIAIYTFFIFITFPIFFGHMSINDRDTIIVFSNIWIAFYTLQYLKLNKEKNKKYIFYFSFLLALGAGVRFAFVVTLIPIILYAFYVIFNSNNKIKFITISYDVTKIIFISLIIILLFWTPTHENLFIKPYQLIKQTFGYPIGYPFIFLNGNVFQSNQIPNSYILQNLFFKSPEYMLFSYLIFFLIVFKIKFFCSKIINQFNLKIIFIIFTILFSNILLIFNPYPVYDGLRLFIFILPYFSIIPAIVLFFLINNLNKKSNKILLIIFAILNLNYIYVFSMLTPYHYTYLNLFAGNFSKVNKKFENDYWGTSLKELIDKIKTNSAINLKSNLRLSICGVGKGSVKYYLKRKKITNYQIVSASENPDFIILANRVLMDYDKENSSKIITCFDKYKGINIEEVKRNGLILSALKKIN